MSNPSDLLILSHPHLTPSPPAYSLLPPSPPHTSPPPPYTPTRRPPPRSAPSFTPTHTHRPASVTPSARPYSLHNPALQPGCLYIIGYFAQLPFRALGVRWSLVYTTGEREGVRWIFAAPPSLVPTASPAPPAASSASCASDCSSPREGKPEARPKRWKAVPHTLSHRDQLLVIDQISMPGDGLTREKVDDALEWVTRGHPAWTYDEGQERPVWFNLLRELGRGGCLGKGEVLRLPDDEGEPMSSMGESKLSRKMLEGGEGSGREGEEGWRTFWHELDGLARVENRKRPPVCIAINRWRGEER